MAETGFINGIDLFCVGHICHFGWLGKRKRYDRIHHARAGSGMLQYFQQSDSARQDMETGIQTGQPNPYDSGIDGIGMSVSDQ